MTLPSCVCGISVAIEPEEVHAKCICNAQCSFSSSTMPWILSIRIIIWLWAKHRMCWPHTHVHCTTIDKKLDLYCLHRYRLLVQQFAKRFCEFLTPNNLSIHFGSGIPIKHLLRSDANMFCQRFDSGNVIGTNGHRSMIRCGDGGNAEDVCSQCAMESFPRQNKMVPEHFARCAASTEQTRKYELH